MPDLKVQKRGLCWLYTITRPVGVRLSRGDQRTLVVNFAPWSLQQMVLALLPYCFWTTSIHPCHSFIPRLPIDCVKCSNWQISIHPFWLPARRAQLFMDRLSSKSIATCIIFKFTLWIETDKPKNVCWALLLASEKIRLVYEALTRRPKIAFARCWALQLELKDKEWGMQQVWQWWLGTNSNSFEIETPTESGRLSSSSPWPRSASSCSCHHATINVTQVFSCLANEMMGKRHTHLG